MGKLLMFITVLSIAFLLCRCSSENGHVGKIIVSYNDTFGYNNVPVYPIAKGDSIIKSVLQKDSFILIFEHGFNQTKIDLNAGRIDTNFIATTTNNLGRAEYFKLFKYKSGINLKIGNERFGLVMPEKHICLLLNYDSVNNQLYANYTNDIPGYK